MANTSTLFTTYDLKIRGLTVSDMQSYLINYDTVDTDLTVLTGATGKHIGIFGLVIVEANAGNLGIKSASTLICQMQLGANSGIIKEVNSDFLIATKKGESLIITSSVALAPFIISVATFDKLYS